MTSITSIIAGITAWVTGMITIVVDVVEASVALFWDGTALTFVGGLALMGIAVGLVTLGIAFVRGLVQR